ncbi:MAG: hypothetical protein LBP35_03410 [Candidatus Ancillula trichonymphae]|jgi:hypothetical protein|nr:hypothetical protein [Candidatus Ancillula trichonymphae]
MNLFLDSENKCAQVDADSICDEPRRVTMPAVGGSPLKYATFAGQNLLLNFADASVWRTWTESSRRIAMYFRNSRRSSV